MRKSKTMWTAFAIAALGAVELQFHVMRDAIPEAYQGLVLVAIGAIMAGLRAVTTKPLSEK